MNKTILIVDDSKPIRQQVSAALGEAGFQVLEAEDGAEGAQMIDDCSIDMVICDISMPRMGGIEMVERVRSNLKHLSLPIIMLTTEGSPSVIKRARELGAKGWIVKPFKPDQLVAVVRKLTARVA